MMQQLSCQEEIFVILNKTKNSVSELREIRQNRTKIVTLCQNLSLQAFLRCECK